MTLQQHPSYKTAQALAETPPNLCDVLTSDRVNKYQIKQLEWCLSYGTTQVNEPILDALQALSDDVETIPQYQRLLKGEHVNVTEDSPVTHHHTRHKETGGCGDDYERMMACCQNIHNQSLCSYNQTPFKHIVQIGIGGSSCGPKAIYHALRYAGPTHDHNLSLDFLTSIDPVERAAVCEGLDWESTLFIVVSKSGTTQETMSNLEYVMKKADSNGLSTEQIQQNLMIITTKGSPLDQLNCRETFYIEAGIGGRFSVTSVAGTLGLTLALGSEKVKAFLQGAAQMDHASLNTNCRENIALCYALLGIWEAHFLGYQGRFIVPYAYGLAYFIDHIKQVWCESLGKGHDIKGNRLESSTSPIIGGEVGTNIQHASFQHVHQGHPIIPIHFIGLKRDQITGEPQNELNAHMVAQIAALSERNRPSTVLLGRQLTPEAVGQLLSIYENMVIFQSFIWGINAFDQPGVELGKSITQQIITKTHNENSVLSSFLDLIH